MVGVGERRTIVVTGGSSGIGLAAAAAFARGGDEVVLLGRDPARLRHAVEVVREAGGRTPAAYRADFAVLAEVRAAGAALAAAHERVDVLVNNAGQLGATGRSVDPVRARQLWEAGLAAVYGEEGERSPRGEP
jgi:NAD(P)-dependent dehydrogenase (short-subunit alcohol dehydrogenase family)